MCVISLAGYASTTMSKYSKEKCGFYGLDLYSLHASIEAVLAYLSNVGPEAAKRARHHYSCFEHFDKNIASYGYAAGFGMTPTCEKAVVKELVGLRRKAMEYLQRDGKSRQMPTSAGSKMLSSFGMRKNIIATCSGAKSILVR